MDFPTQRQSVLTVRGEVTASMDRIAGTVLSHAHTVRLSSSHCTS
jgi:hypothetical protein